MIDVIEPVTKAKVTRPLWKAFCVSTKCCKYVQVTKKLKADGTYYSSIKLKTRVHKYSQNEKPMHNEKCPDCAQNLHFKLIKFPNHEATK